MLLQFRTLQGFSIMTIIIIDDVLSIKNYNPWCKIIRRFLIILANLLLTLLVSGLII